MVKDDIELIFKDREAGEMPEAIGLPHPIRVRIRGLGEKLAR